MTTAAQHDVVSIKTDYSCTTDCTTRLGRISTVDLYFKDTAGPYPSPALHLQIVVIVDDVTYTYEQPLGTTYPHGDHKHEHTHNQITSLMRLTRVRHFSDAAGQPVLVLFGIKDPKVVYGVCDIEKKLFCNTQSMPVLVWDE